MTTFADPNLFEDRLQDVRELLAAPAPEPVQDAAPEARHDHCDAERQRLEADLHSLREQARRRAAQEQAAAEAKKGFGAWIDANGAWLALYATIGLTASGEFSLATLAGWPVWIAWLLPSAIDIYVTVALRRHRDMVAALGLMLIANVAYHLAAMRLFGTTPDGVPKWWLIAGAATIAPYVMWRVHHLTAPPKTKRETAQAPARETAPMPAETRLTGTVSAPHETVAGASHGTPRDGRETTAETPLGASRETAHETRPSQRETPSPVRSETPRTRRRTTTNGSSTNRRKTRGETPVQKLLPLDEQMRITQGIVDRHIAEHGDIEGVLLKVAAALGVSKATAGRRVKDLRKTA